MLSIIPSFLILLALMVLSGGTIYLISLIVRFMVWLGNLPSETEWKCASCGRGKVQCNCWPEDDYCSSGSSAA